MIAQAAAVSVATDVDDRFVLALFFARVADGRRGASSTTATTGPVPRAAGSASRR